MLARSVLHAPTRIFPSHLKRSLSSTSTLSFSTTVDAELSDFENRGPSFGLSQDQQAFQDLARSFTAEHITPNAAEHDRTMKYPIEIIRKAHEAGLMNLHVPEQVRSCDD